jgi:hypothetical protein
MNYVCFILQYFAFDHLFTMIDRNFVGWLKAVTSLDAGIEIALCVTIYREVSKARCKKTRKLVALKKVVMENEKEGVCVLHFTGYFVM